ncbi:hypothetical protein GOODEAATRI_000384, partial [Goodea atripinnis]
MADILLVKGKVILAFLLLVQNKKNMNQQEIVNLCSSCITKNNFTNWIFSQKEVLNTLVKSYSVTKLHHYYRHISAAFRKKSILSYSHCSFSSQKEMEPELNCWRLVNGVVCKK